MPIHGCGQPVRWVTIDNVSVAVEPTPHNRGTIAAPRREFWQGYVIPHDKAPAPGYTRHRAHECPTSPDTAPRRAA